jgi:protein-L-isoaspartate(D-aspartate) O-methyltransferase
MAAADVTDERIEAAFAAVARELFLGPDPWQILRWFRGYAPPPSDDPVYLYADPVVRHSTRGRPLARSNKALPPR